MQDQLDFDRRLARRTDPVTSHAAAGSLDLTLTTKHQLILDWLAENGPATDLEMAEAMVRLGHYAREESARRAVRTLREEHGRMVEAVDEIGLTIFHRNSTGREAVCWVVGDGTRRNHVDTIRKAAARSRVRTFLDSRRRVHGGFPPDGIITTAGHVLYASDLEELL